MSKILIIEDEEAIADLEKDYLELSGFEVEIENRQIREEWELHKESAKNYLFDHMDRELAGHMEEVRMGRKELGEKANDQ